jgi:hypothetical protein
MPVVPEGARHATINVKPPSTSWAPGDRRKDALKTTAPRCLAFVSRADLQRFQELTSNMQDERLRVT